MKKILPYLIPLYIRAYLQKILVEILIFALLKLHTAEDQERICAFFLYFYKRKKWFHQSDKK